MSEISMQTKEKIERISFKTSIVASILLAVSVIWYFTL